MDVSHTGLPSTTEVLMENVKIKPAPRVLGHHSRSHAPLSRLGKVMLHLSGGIPFHCSGFDVRNS